MPCITIGSVENLQDAVQEMNGIAESISAECRHFCTEAGAKCKEAGEAVQCAFANTEAAKTNLAEARQALAEALSALDAARAEVAAAQAALSSCRLQPKANCSSEESALATAEACEAAAEASVRAAETAVTAAHQEVQAAYAALEECKAMQHNLEESARDVRERTQAEEAQVKRIREDGIKRLKLAQQDLQRYLSRDMHAARLHRWLHPAVHQGAGPLRPDALRERLQMPAPELKLYMGYLMERDSGFRGRVNAYRAQLRDASGQAGRHAVLLKVRKNLGGYLAERLVADALKPYCERVNTQGRTYFPDGRYTKTDIIAEGFRQPLVLGRGEGRFVPVGGKLAAEIKCGGARYIYQQKEHMKFQAAGHKQADAAMCICSGDVQDLSAPLQENLRAELRDAGSPLIGLLPRKEEVDKACWEIINDTPETKP